jgi:hypothetical protein
MVWVGLTEENLHTVIDRKGRETKSVSSEPAAGQMGLDIEHIVDGRKQAAREGAA